VKSIVILGSSVTALGVLRQAHRLGLSCSLFDTRPGIAMNSRLAKRMLVHGRDAAALLPALQRLGGTQSAIIATEDRWLELLLASRAVIDAAYGTVLVPSNHALRICLNKAAFARWCADQALPAPRSWSLEQLDDITLPALIRPLNTRHDRNDDGVPKAIFVDSRHALHEWAGRFRARYLEGLASESLLDRKVIQYSVPIARRDGEMLSFVARKLRPPASWARTGTYVELCPNAEVERLARSAIEVLDYSGIGEVEILQSQTDGLCYLIEINARPWVQYSLAAASGHDLLAFMLKMPSRKGANLPSKQGFRWMSFRADLYVCFSRSEGLVPRKELSLSAYLVSLLKANAFAHFDWRDPWPAIIELAALVREACRALFRRLASGQPRLEKGS
jgi:predicted ATP-grasp superfamily ATP-dependent carboligase